MLFYLLRILWGFSNCRQFKINLNLKNLFAKTKMNFYVNVPPMSPNFPSREPENGCSTPVFPSKHPEIHFTLNSSLKSAFFEGKAWAFFGACLLFLHEAGLADLRRKKKGKSTKNGKNFKDSEQATPKTYKFKKMSSFIDEGMTADPNQEDQSSERDNGGFNASFKGTSFPRVEGTPLRTPSRFNAHFLETSSKSRKSSPCSSVRKLNLDGLGQDDHLLLENSMTSPFLHEPVKRQLPFQNQHRTFPLKTSIEASFEVLLPLSFKISRWVSILSFHVEFPFGLSLDEFPIEFLFPLYFP